jgi:hypothetical protein
MLGFKTATAAVAVVGSLLLAACGSGGQTGGTTPTAVGASGATPTASDRTSSTPPSSDQAAAAPDVCTVLTAAQVAAILDVASVTTSGTPSTIAYISTCGYSPPADGPHPYPVEVSLDVKDGSAASFGSIQQTLAPTAAVRHQCDPDHRPGGSHSLRRLLGGHRDRQRPHRGPAMTANTSSSRSAATLDTHTQIRIVC